MTNKLLKIKTLGDLKKSNYTSLGIKQELRKNLIEKLKNKEPLFKGIIGYDQTVIPDFERAILSQHNTLLLGLRGQAKTRMARQLLDLLDEYVPVVQGSEVNDDPLQPISRFARTLIEEQGDGTPITWLHRSQRYGEKLATPDVSVSDLIGDVDPIKAATLKLPYSDERVIHFGLIPRSNRCIFVINELPDLQARIQVSLFNILEEGDIQIRGFKLRMPLDVQFVFTANPEDYTNRGSIVTPLKDRIPSQILTHYAPSIEVSREITEQEAKLTEDQVSRVVLNPIARDLVEQIAFEARQSEFVDAKSGVSARMTITALENLVSSAERRAIINGEEKTHVRIADFWGVIPSITGKIELVYEGEQEGPFMVALSLFEQAIRTLFTDYFTDPTDYKNSDKPNPYAPIMDWFAENQMEILNDFSHDEYANRLKTIEGLSEIVELFQPNATAEEQLFLMEFALHGLAAHSQLSKNLVQSGFFFKDLFSSMFSGDIQLEDEDDPEDYF